MIDIGVIPAAGRGLRLAPYTENTPKTLFQIGGKSLLERNIDILVNRVGVKKIFIIYGHLSEQIVGYLRGRLPPEISLEFVCCPDPSVGLANGLLLLKDRIHSPFVTILGDELYLDSNHEKLNELSLDDIEAACGYFLCGDADQIRQNYSLRIKNHAIASLREKPQFLDNELLGCGTFVFKPAIFDDIQHTRTSARTGKVELVDVINRIAQKRGRVAPVQLEGNYRNINTEKDYISAIHLYRKKHFKDYKTSLVIPAYNEESSLAHVLVEFSGKVDEIVIAASSASTDRTVEIAQKSGHRTVVDNFKGYGDALKRGMQCASGDILILVEADGSFTADDLPKLLSYLTDADMVLGTRTTKQMIVQGANMKWMLRWGNVFAAKILQILWISQEPRFTDLGCTYRALWKDCFHLMEKNLQANGPEFSPEMMVEALKSKRNVIEIPVTYRARFGGDSKHSASFVAILKTASRMLLLIFKKTTVHFLGRS